MTRVLVVTSTFPRWRGDTEPRFVFDLCRYLQNRGFEVDVLAPHAPGAARRERLEGVEVHRYRYFLTRLQTLAYGGGILARLRRNPLNYLLVPFLLAAQALAVYRRLNAASYEILHAHWLIPQGTLCALAQALLSRRAPALLCTSHGGDLYALNAWPLGPVKRWTAGRCAALCVVSQAMAARALAMGVEPGRIRVLPMGVDLLTTFVPAAGVARVDQRLIFVGRLVEKKGVHVLLQAMKTVVDRFPGAELLVIGDGPLRAELERQSGEPGLAGRVAFRGAVTHGQLPDLYSSAAVAVVPSIVAGSGDQEGLGLVAVEALGCGCAVVASSLPALADVIDPASGVTARPGDPADLAEKICTLLADPERRRRLAEQGRQRVLARYDWRSACERYAELLGELARPAPPPC